MVKVLCYHRISNIRNDYNLINVSIDNFRNQMKWLSENYKMISLKEYDNYVNTGDETIAITFDDGYRDVLENAIPILEEFDIPATLFITTGILNTQKEAWTDNLVRCIFEPDTAAPFFEWHDEELDGIWDVGTLEERVSFYRKMSIFLRGSSCKTRLKFEKALFLWAGLDERARADRMIISNSQLFTISKHALITVGAHCVSHPSLGRIGYDEQEKEIKESIESVKQITGKTVDYFAYPFGGKIDYTCETIELLKKYDIKKAFTTQCCYSLNVNNANYEIPRIVCPNYNQVTFKTWFKSVAVLGDNEDDAMHHNIDYYCGALEKDDLLWNDDVKLIIWGVGHWGTRLYYDLQLCGVKDKILAFGDNDPNKIGNQMFGLSIISVEDVLQYQAKYKAIVLVKGDYDLDIAYGLKAKRIQNIHVINKV